MLSEVSWLNQAWVQASLGLAALLLLAGCVQWGLEWLVNRVVARLRLAQRVGGVLAVLLERSVLHRMAQVLPALLVLLLVHLVPQLHPTVIRVAENVASALIVLFVARALLRMLDVALQRHGQTRQNGRSIKAYVQMGQLLVGIAAVVVMIAALADKSPLIVLSGFGAMSAVLMLIFQDTIKSFVAGLQIEGNDMLRVGDWIEVPQAGADGAVVDVALNTVKVQNWDKTIVTIPTWKLMSESFKNWRGMQESGGRRIKRTLMLDAGSIRFLDDAEIARLRQVHLIADYMREKADAVQISRAMVQRELGAELSRVPANQRRLTNIGTFRAYVLAYLKANHSVHQGMTMMVRMMQPTPEGVPMELYCFANTTAWVDYEAIQSDIFDHLLAVLPEFGLRSFQAPGGADLRGLARSLGHGADGIVGADGAVDQPAPGPAPAPAGAGQASASA